MALSQVTKLMGPTWGPPGSCWPQMGPMLAPWTLLSGLLSVKDAPRSSGQVVPSWKHGHPSPVSNFMAVPWNCILLCGAVPYSIMSVQRISGTVGICGEETMRQIKRLLWLQLGPFLDDGCCFGEISHMSDWAANTRSGGSANYQGIACHCLSIVCGLDSPDGSYNICNNSI